MSGHDASLNKLPSYRLLPELCFSQYYLPMYLRMFFFIESIQSSVLRPIKITLQEGRKVWNIPSLFFRYLNGDVVTVPHRQNSKKLLVTSCPCRTCQEFHFHTRSFPLTFEIRSKLRRTTSDALLRECFLPLTGSWNLWTKNIHWNIKKIEVCQFSFCLRIGK